MNLIVLDMIFLSLRSGRNNDRNEKIDLDRHQLVPRDVSVSVGVELGDGRDRGAEVEVGIGIGALSLGDGDGVVTCSRTQLVGFSPRNADGDLGSSGFYELVGWEKTSPSEYDL